MTEPTDKWQPIETAPKDGTRILACDGGPVIVWWTDVSHDGRKGWASGDSAGPESWWFDECHPTHWMMIPARP